jgi:hypothetical protein
MDVSFIKIVLKGASAFRDVVTGLTISPLALTITRNTHALVSLLDVHRKELPQFLF